jgi:sulfur relay (sulfurtransferase) DsrC/TusE family protein
MATVEYMGKTFTVDEDGFIDDYKSYCDEWVQWVKHQEGIE